MGVKVTQERVEWFRRVKHGESIAVVARDVGLSGSRIRQICQHYDFLLANPWDWQNAANRDLLLEYIGADVDCMPREVFANPSEFLAGCAKHNRKG